MSRVLRAYFISDRVRLSDGDLLAAIARAAAEGVHLIQIRENDLPTRVLEGLVAAAVRLTDGSASQILVNDRLDVALACGATGVHLPASGIPVRLARRFSPPGFLIGASTHSFEEALEAADSGADLLVFGPVYETASKPGATPLGIPLLSRIVRAVAVPVFALGGITAERVDEVAQAGAAGVAGISVFTNDEAVRRLMEALGRWS